MDVSAVSSGKNAKEVRDERLRGAKIEEQVLKSMNNMSIEEKFNSLLKKYVELDKDNKKTNTLLKQGEKRLELMLREKDNLQKEHNKGILMRDKLEQVCREQQKLIKSVKNESMTKIREEEERRKENQVKFQHSINEISVTLNKNNDENLKLKDDNNEMRNKIKFLAEQYHVCEKQLEKMNEQIVIESQLHEAKLAKIQMESTIEKEIILREKQTALSELLTCKKAIQEIQRREDILKDQLNMYTSKYDDFQTSLQKSNDIFTTYKSEIEKMTKKTKKLEKESIEWKRKWEKSNSSLLDLASEKQVRDEYIAKNVRQMNQLQKLLRTLQAERTTLHQVLKDNNIERPPMPVLPPEPAPVSLPPPVKSLQPDKMEIMAKSCAELKETLANLQGQMNAITSKQSKDIQQTTEISESKKPNKNKKSKSKNKSVLTKGRQNQSEDIEVNAPIDEPLVCPTLMTETEENTVPTIANSDSLPSITEDDLQQIDSERLESNDEVTIKCTIDENCLSNSGENSKLSEIHSEDPISEALAELENCSINAEENAKLSDNQSGNSISEASAGLINCLTNADENSKLAENPSGDSIAETLTGHEINLVQT